MPLARPAVAAAPPVDDGVAPRNVATDTTSPKRIERITLLPESATYTMESLLGAEIPRGLLNRAYVPNPFAYPATLGVPASDDVRYK